MTLLVNNSLNMLISISFTYSLHPSDMPAQNKMNSKEPGLHSYVQVMVIAFRLVIQV